MNIEPDDLRSHRNLGADLMKMDNEKRRLAMWDDLVSALDYWLPKDDPLPGLGQSDIRVASMRAHLRTDEELLKRARALQK